MSQPTQVTYPWRSTIRTAFQVAIAACAIWALVVEAAGVDQTNTIIASTIAAAAGVNRIMALPAVNDFIAKFVPWLAAEPKA
jgi:hypothetical protein